MEWPGGEARFCEGCAASNSFGTRWAVTPDRIACMLERRTDGKPERALGTVVLPPVKDGSCSQAIVFASAGKPVPEITTLPEGFPTAVTKGIRDCQDMGLSPECPAFNARRLLRLLQESVPRHET